MKYRQDIDGLRAIAVLSVLFYHAGFDFFDGGYLGVDIFFVISGFLISSQIMNQLEAGTFSILTFYEKRARRLLPALFLVVMCCPVMGYLLLKPSDLITLGESMVSSILFSTNIYFFATASYFSSASEMAPLIHLWSLGIEEQFYIVYPMLMIFMIRFRLRMVFVLFGILFLASFALNEFCLVADPDFAFYMLPTRMWEFFIGTFAALITRHFPSKMRLRRASLLSIVGLFLVLVPIPIYFGVSGVTGFLTGIPLLGTFLILVYCREGSLVYSLLTTRFMTTIGLLSYSLYLWHQPIFSFCKHYLYEDLSTLQTWMLLTLTLLLSYLTWRFVEQPFRKAVYPRGTFFRKIAILAPVLILSGLLLHYDKGFRSRAFLQDIFVLNYEPNNRQLRLDSLQPLCDYTKDESYGPLRNKADRLLWFDLHDSRPKMLLMGNSHSKDLWNVLHLSPSVTASFQVARYGVRIAEITDETLASPNVVHADIICFVTRYSENDLKSLDAVIKTLRDRGKQVVLVKAIFDLPYEKNRTLVDKMLLPHLDGDFDFSEIPELVKTINREHYRLYQNRGPHFSDAVLNELAIKYQLVLLDRMDYVVDHQEQQFYAVNEELSKYTYDYGHHTMEGAKFYAKRIEAIDWLRDVTALLKKAETNPAKSSVD